MNRRKVIRFRRSPTMRLAATYLAIIMVLSISFSLVFYYTCTHALNHLLPPSFIFSGSGHFVPGPDFNHFFQSMLDQGRQALRNRLILLNAIALFGGALLSYYFTRRTLLPIENAMEAQNRFVTDASHELRTPITAILTNNEVALRKPSLNLSGAKDIIKSNMDEMIKLKVLSDGLLNLAKQDEESAIVFKPILLQDVAGEAMNHMLRAAQAKHISIEDSVPAIRVLGDMNSLVQAVVILLDNAIKYSPEKSIIYLEGYTKDKAGYLTVRDEGNGINADDLPHIFERFYRSDESRTKSDTNGYGIGLSIAKKITEQHHGKILSKSVPGKGSSFTLKLPLSK